MATTTNWSGLTEYIDVHRDELIAKASASVKELDYFDLLLGVKHKETIPTLDTTIVFHDGSACGWNPDGSDIIGEVTIEVNPLEVEKEYCQRDFEKSFANYQLRWAAGRETLPFEEQIVNNQLNAINEALSVAIWSGNTAAGMSGLTEILEAQSGNTTNVDFSGKTIVEQVDAMVAGIPNDAFKYGYEGKVDIFMNYTQFRQYVAALNAQCCGKIGIVDANQDEMAYIGDSRVRLVPVDGLASYSIMVAAPARSLAYGTDVENSENIYDMWFDRKDAKFLFRVLFMAGVQVKLPGFTVVGQ